jgi:hypothetical protein
MKRKRDENNNEPNKRRKVVNNKETPTKNNIPILIKVSDTKQNKKFYENPSQELVIKIISNLNTLLEQKKYILVSDFQLVFKIKSGISLEFFLSNFEKTSYFILLSNENNYTKFLINDAFFGLNELLGVKNINTSIRKDTHFLQFGIKLNGVEYKTKKFIIRSRGWLKQKKNRIPLRKDDIEIVIYNNPKLIRNKYK